MEFEWDPRKAASNAGVHGVDFADAAFVLYDELALTVEDLGDYSERRFVTIGTDPFGRVLVLAYTWRGERVRLISARRATPAERRRYESKR